MESTDDTIAAKTAAKTTAMTGRTGEKTGETADSDSPELARRRPGRWKPAARLSTPQPRPHANDGANET
jgi:hypothetical protein